MKKKIFFCAFLLFFTNFFVKAQVMVTFKTIIKNDAVAKADQLFLAGNFNGWNPSAPEWRMQHDSKTKFSFKTFLKPGDYSFKITRGSWQKVECGAFGKAIANREIKIIHDTTITMSVEGWQDSFPEVEKPHTASKQVHIISDKFNMPQLGKERRIWIYLPADYESSQRNYPVIYMHDGQNLFDEHTAGYEEWGVDELMDKMPVNNQCIIVGVDHGEQDRISEYDPYDSEHGKGRGDAYAAFLIESLKPYIDGHYCTLTDAAHTTIAGSSMGGLISMYTALKYPTVFGNAGIFSPAFWIAPDIYKYAEKLPLLTNRFYFVCGDEESDTMVADMQKMAAIIRSKGVTEPNAPTVVIKGAKHNEKQWHDDFTGFYHWLQEGYR